MPPRGVAATASALHDAMHIGPASGPEHDATVQPSRSAPSSLPCELSVIIPTFNEKENIEPLVRLLAHVLEGMAWEAIFVDDDSPDGTADVVRNLAARFPNLRCLQRIGRRGLSTACIEGMLASSAPFLAVLDADMQHDASILPLMLHTLKRDRLEIVVASRYVSGGGIGTWEPSRARLSDFATKISRLTLGASLHDPMSGFFLLRRSLLDKTVRRLSGKGFKILLDIFMSAETPMRFAEIPYEMRSRARGASKLDLLAAWEFIELLADKLIGRFVPVRFIAFVLVGLGGAVMHLTVLGILTQLLQQPFIVGQSAAAVIAMTVNFFLNNLLTYRDRRLQGWDAIRGLISFYVVCGLGASINVVVAGFLFDNGIAWWLAGLLGATVGAVWNFAISSSFTWRHDRRRSVAAREPRG